MTKKKQKILKILMVIVVYILIFYKLNRTISLLNLSIFSFHFSR